MDSSGFVRIHKDLQRFTWICGDLWGCERINEDLREFTGLMRICEDSPEFLRIHENSWGFAGTHKNTWEFARISGIHEESQVSVVFYAVEAWNMCSNCCCDTVPVYFKMFNCSTRDFSIFGRTLRPGIATECLPCALVFCTHVCSGTPLLQFDSTMP